MPRGERDDSFRSARAFRFLEGRDVVSESVAYAIQAPTMVEAMAACRGRQWCERPVNQIIARPMGLNHAADAAENAHPICRVRTGQLMLGARDWRQGMVVRRT